MALIHPSAPILRHPLVRLPPERTTWLGSSFSFSFSSVDQILAYPGIVLHQVSRTSAPLPYRDGDLLQVTVLELQLAPSPHYSSNPGDYHLPGYNPAQYLELDILQDRPFTLVIVLCMEAGLPNYHPSA